MPAPRPPVPQTACRLQRVQHGAERGALGERGRGIGEQRPEGGREQRGHNHPVGGIRFKMEASRTRTFCALCRRTRVNEIGLTAAV